MAKQHNAIIAFIFLRHISPLMFPVPILSEYMVFQSTSTRERRTSSVNKAYFAESIHRRRQPFCFIWKMNATKCKRKIWLACHFDEINFGPIFRLHHSKKNEISIWVSILFHSYSLLKSKRTRICVI